MSVSTRYLLTLAALVPLLLSLGAIRSLFEAGTSHLHDMLIPTIVWFGIINVVGGVCLFAPIKRYLRHPDGTAVPSLRIVHLPLWSAFWVFMISTLRTAHSDVLAHDSALVIALRVVTVSSYLGGLIYFLVNDLCADLRRDIQLQHGHVIEPSGSGFLIKLLAGLLVTGALPYVMLMTAHLEHQGDGLHRELVVISFQLLVAIGIVAYSITHSLNRPLDDLARAFEKASSGDMRERTVVTTQDQIGALAMGFNRMMGGLEERDFLRGAMGRLVPESVAAEVLRDRGKLEARTREATVLFTDMVGFTALSEKVAPQTLIEILNEYFAIISQPVVELGGVITQFQGDAMLVTFNLPVEDPAHAQNAVRAAMAIVAASEGRMFHGESIGTRVGVNTGLVVGGLVSGGDRVGYTVHGEQVNLAARLEQMNKTTGTKVLLSKRTAELAQAVGPFTSVGEMPVRGLQQPVEVFTPSALLETQSSQD